MAPEQAAGDPGTDHRADVYAWGMVAYEIFAGAHPYSGRTSAQALLAAQMSERPRALAELRPDLPLPLAALVTQCLEKEPAHRPQSAQGIIDALDAAATPREGSAAAVSAERPAPSRPGRAMLVRALGIYAAAFVGALVFAKAAIVGIGLPTWVLSGTIMVMAIGLPVILFTAYVHQVSARAATQTTFATLAVKASPHVSWRRTALGGAWALGAFVAIVAGYMTMRALGIGPAGSLLAAGVIENRDQLLVADFSIVGTDSLLGRAVTEAIRTDLGQSDVMRLVPASVVAQTLTFMEKPAASPIDTGIARVIAVRAGIKAVLGGDISPVGSSYTLTARLIAPSTGNVLAAFRENASDQRDLLPAVERLSRSLRAKLGESLRRIQGDPPLTQVTTSSLDALRLYAQGLHAGDDLGDVPRGMRLLQEAVQRDSTFAMAWRKLGTWSNNNGDAIAETYAKKAVDNAAHLTTRERYLALGSYYTTAGDGYDVDKSITILERAVEADSTDATAWVNLAIQQSGKGLVDSGIVLAGTSARRKNTYALYHLSALLRESGRNREADSMQIEAHAAAPNFPYRTFFDVMAFHLRRQYDSAEATAHRGKALGLLASEQLARGRLGAASTTLQQLADSLSARGDLGGALDAVATWSWIASTFRNQPAVAAAALEAAEKKYPLDQQPVSKRPYYQLAAAYAVAGRPERARQLIREGDQRYSPGLARYFKEPGMIARGLTALAEQKPSDAVAALNGRAFCGGTSPRAVLPRVAVRCPAPFLAAAYDRAGEVDSARAVLSRYVSATNNGHIHTDALVLGQSLQRLGEIEETKGDRQAAARHYARLLDLWKDADSELKPRIDDVRKRLARLSETERK